MMKKMKRMLFVVPAIVFTAALFFGCAGTNTAAKNADAEYELVILNTNDHHGAVNGTKDKDGVTHGGLAIEASFVKQIRTQHKNVLLLDAGDINAGQNVSNIFNAEPDIRAYNAMKYDAVTLGNHEFDGGLEKLNSQMDKSEFPWISANTVLAGRTLVRPYIIKNFGGFRVAVIGLTTCRTAIVSSQKGRTDKNGNMVSFKPEIETAQKMVDTVRTKDKADIVILCGHIGDVREDKDHVTSLDIAEAVKGIDLIIDGHSHSHFDAPEYAGGVPIVTTEGSTKFIGEGIMTVKAGKVQQFTWQPVELTDKVYPADAETAAMLKPYNDKEAATMGTVVFKTTAPFEFGKRLTRYQEMASGDYTTDAMVAALRNSGISADFAVINGGSIRAEIPAGNVTRGNILTMLPFTNTVMAVTLKGSDVNELFKYIGSIKQGAGAFAQVSDGVKYTITYDADGNGTISDVTVHGKPIDPDKDYIVGTNDYMAGGGDGYVIFKKAESSFNTSLLIYTALVNYCESFKTAVTPAAAGRITVLGGKLPE